MRWLVGTALIVAASSAGAQRAPLAERLDAETARTVTRLADSLRAAGLPDGPIVDLALEGASRRASSDRIIAAVREYAALLGEARVALGAAASADEIASGAATLVAGVAPSFLGDYRAARPRESLSVPLVVLADLVARGVPAEAAASAVGGALRDGAGDEEFARLRQSIERDIRSGAAPLSAVRRRFQLLPRNRGPAGRTRPTRPLPQMGKPSLP